MLAYLTPFGIGSKTAHGFCHTSVEMTNREYCACYRHAEIGQQTAHVTIGMQREVFRHKGRMHREDRQLGWAGQANSHTGPDLVTNLDQQGNSTSSLVSCQL